MIAPFRIASFRATSLLAIALLGAACGGTPPAATPPAAATEPAAVQIGSENVITVVRETIVTGPLISGELRAAREVTIRAELGGPVTSVEVEEGQAVRRGDLLARIGTRALAAARQSAESSLTSAENQAALARRELERTEQLVAAGALAARDLDVSRSAVAAADAQVADARSRLANTDTQLGDAVLRAPFNGVVSERAVEAGDVVSPGTAMFTIIDPSTMRLEASVSSEDIASLRPGADVQFEVRGYPQTFQGRIERIAPQADAATRQVPIYVGLANAGGRLVAGLFAEGRVVVESATGLVVPANAVNDDDEAAWALRVKDGKAERVRIVVGLRDTRTERVQVTSGLDEGDTVLRGAAQAITPGTPVAIGAMPAGR